MVKIIHIVKSDASGTIGADQLGRLGFAPLKAGVCIRGAQVGQDAVICVAEQQIIRNWFLQFRDLKCAPTNAFGMKLPFPLLALPAAFGLLHIGEQEDQYDPKPPEGEYPNQQPSLPRSAHQSHDGDNSTNQNGDAAAQKSFVVTHFFAVLPVNFA